MGSLLRPKAWLSAAISNIGQINLIHSTHAEVQSELDALKKKTKELETAIDKWKVYTMMEHPTAISCTYT